MKRKYRNKTQRSDDANAFIPESGASLGAGDELAQFLAEKHQRSVVADEDDAGTQDALCTEELGGPFVETTSEVEFGRSMSEEGDPEDEQSSLPEAVGPLALASAEEETEEVEARVNQTGDHEPPDAQDELPSQIEPGLERVTQDRWAAR